MDPSFFEIDLFYLGEYENIDGVLDFLTQYLQQLVRKSKAGNLNCSKVSLPLDLLPRIARDIFDNSFQEPCGLRGSTLFLNLKVGSETTSLGRVKWDPMIASTFNVHVNLTQHSRNSSWYKIFPRWLLPRRLELGDLVVISDQYTIEIEKLYRRDLRADEV